MSTGARYSAAYDLYSLGVVLCEIGQWASVDTGRFVHRSQNVQHRFPPKELAKIFLLREGDRHFEFSLSKGLAHRMGSYYQQAVESCFAFGNSGAETPWVLENIVLPLEKAAIGIPD